MRIRRMMTGIAAGGLLATGAVMINPAQAFADELADGQYVDASDYECGSQEIATGASGGPEDALRQRALVYKNCSGSDVKRKADIIADFDGTCYTIPAGKARTLDALFVFAGRDTYRSAKTC